MLFVLVELVVIGLLARSELRTDDLGDGFASGNGRIEANEIDLATKLGKRIREIRVDEGDFVQPGQVIARMDTEVLEAGQLTRAWRERDECVRRCSCSAGSSAQIDAVFRAQRGCCVRRIARGLRCFLQDLLKTRIQMFRQVASKRFVITE